MNFEDEFPVRFFLNLGRRSDRRGEMEWNLFEAAIEAERFPAIDGRFLNCSRGYEHEGRYALALTRRLAIREARARGASAVLLFEDDVVFHSNFRALVERLELPDDWGIFFFGCAHEKQPEVVSDGLVRVEYAVDNHAVAIRAPYFNQIIGALNLHNKPVPVHALASDRVLAELQQKIPTYAAFPNLAWQTEVQSDLAGTKYTQYGKAGVTKREKQLTWSCLREMTIGSSKPKNPRLGLLFLTRGDVNHPKIWSEWFDQAHSRVKVFSHVKEPSKAKDGFLSGTQIKERFETQWGQIGLVRASRAMLVEALEDEDLTHFALLSESCVPIKPLREILRRLELDPRSQFKCNGIESASQRKKCGIHEAPRVSPNIWRFQSQWWLLDRTTAIFASRNDYTALFESMYVPDEAYFSTVLTMEGYPIEDLVFQESSTWTHWEEGEGSPESHPKLSPRHLQAMVRSHAIFARKFPPGADIGKYELHLPAES